MQVFVFGATGVIGSEIVRALIAQPDVKVRVATRNVETARAAFGDSAAVQPVTLDFQRPETLDAALAGVNRLIIVNPLAPDMAAQTAALVAAGRRANVSLVVRFSLLGAGEPDPIEEALWHHAADMEVRQGGLPWVILKPNQYFQNFVSEGTLQTVRGQSAIYVPYAESRVSNIDTRDLGEIAARVALADPHTHAGKEYLLTGAAAHTMGELAAAIGAARGKPVQYVAVPEEAARQGMLGAGVPAAIVEVILQWISYCRAGRAERVEPAAAALLGRAPRGYADFARDYAHRYNE